MKSETLQYGKELLSMLDKIGREISLPEFEEKSKVKGDELKELLRYLQKKEYLRYKLGLFVNTSKLGDSTIKLLPKGIEVVLGERDYFNESRGVSIHDSQIAVAQTTGDGSPITQIQNNSQINVLKQLIKNDKELDEPKKDKLFSILEKFNTLKESGENAFELIKKVGEIALKYVPLFFNLLP